MKRKRGVGRVVGGGWVGGGVVVVLELGGKAMGWAFGR